MIGEVTAEVHQKIIAEIRKQIEERDRKKLEELEEKLAAERQKAEIAKIEKKHDLLLKDLESRARQEAIKARCLKEGIRDLHLMPDEDPEKCEIVLIAPVLSDQPRPCLEPESIRPPWRSKQHEGHILFPFSYKLGKHKSCYCEMKKPAGGVSISKYRQLSDTWPG